MKTIIVLLITLIVNSAFAQVSYPYYGKEKATDSQIKTALPVALLKNKVRGTRCNSFLITDNLLITNMHCIEHFNYNANDLKVTFNYDTDNAEDFYCDTVLFLDKSLDLALLRVKGNPGKKYGSVVFSTKMLDKNDDILLIHYNNDNFQYKGKVKQLFSEGKSLHDEKNISLFYNAYTLPGTSGSPVFYKNKNDNKHYLIGLHNVHYGNKLAYKTMKGAVSANKIYDKIMTLPNVNPHEIKLQNNKIFNLKIDYYKSGQIRSSGYVLGLREKKYMNSDEIGRYGKWNWYYENGNLWIQRFYSLVNNGFLIGESKSFYENGSIRRIMNYASVLTMKEMKEHLKDNGMLEGEFKNFYDNGKLRTIGYYHKDKKDKLWKYYRYDGKLDFVLDYSKPETINRIVSYYHENGKDFERGRLVNGERDGVWEFFKPPIWQSSPNSIDRIKRISTIYDDENKHIGYRKKYKNGKELSSGRGLSYAEPDKDKLERFCSVINNKCIYYYRNGNVKYEREYDDNGNVGKFLTGFSKNGAQTLKDGNGCISNFYKNGSIEFKSEIKNGGRNGYTSWYYDNGILDTKILYKYNHSDPLGYRMEIISSNNIDGSPREKGTLKDGNGTTIDYGANGQKIKTNLYKNGEKISN